MNALDAHQTEDHRAVQAQLCAYNTAFAELGLRFRWDTHTLLSLATIDGEHARIVAYIETHHPHLLNAYSAEFLGDAILAKKSARVPEMVPTRNQAGAGAREPAASRGFSLGGYWGDEGGVPGLAGA
ncbi:hypothetical protein [Paraburkholderia sp.]|uniref:hypothetical protein n=1 Tax=Paraburkholderia sp. TaxID=1926495 RepID=UPI00238E50B6|nr:hypothetical protein [Paraburkholderia sp.]MDE1182432.1 hypothetical protein [Paraburkholderia sp.]